MSGSLQTMHLILVSCYKSSLSAEDLEGGHGGLIVRVMGHAKGQTLAGFNL